MIRKLFLLGFCIYSITLFTSFHREKNQKGVKTIIIDPGHGGINQGAKGLISTEAQLTLQISKKLGKEIERNFRNIKVLYTRTTDAIPGNMPDHKQGNRYRAEFANNSGADLFISIHCNFIGKAPGGWYEKKIIDYNHKISYKGKGKKRKKVITKIPVYQPYYVVNKVTGTETFIWTAKESVKKQNSVSVQGEFSGEENDEAAMTENDPAIKALRLLYTKKYFRSSLHFAELVQAEFAKAGRVNRGVQQRNWEGIWVLHATGMPSVLIETGFISNKEEEEYLNSDKGQEEIVENISSALRSYIEWNEKKEMQQSIPTSKNNRSNIITTIYDAFFQKKHPLFCNFGNIVKMV
ncbi:MAG: N-acetylmuramoyl-L-alanine amidase [Chitinophagaceae bacterium]